MELQKAMNRRRSIRSYTGEGITEEQLNAVLNAAYEAPVGMGRYDSIHLTIITNKDLLAAIDANAAEFFGNPKLHPLYGAPMLIVISSSTDGNIGSADVGFIIENMSLAAVDEGIGQCAIYGAVAAVNKNKELLDKLNLPQGFTPEGAVILGKTNEEYKERTIPEARKYGLNTID